jgi:pimeloyl-ACP methyl ester carboxylesterase
MKKGYADTTRGQVHYCREGDNGPDLFLFHESPLSSREFERCIPILGRSTRVVAFDTPGYGAPDAPEAPTTIEDYASWLLEAIDAVGVEEFDVAGVHTGAAIAVELIRKAGRRVTHAVFSGMPLMSAERKAEAAERIGEPAAQEDGSHLMRMWQARIDGWGRDTPLEQLEMAASDTMRVYDRHDWGFKAVFAHDCEPALKELECPVLFVNAEGDRLADADRKAAQLVPGSVLKIIPDVAGQLPWRAPEVYAREILEFIGVPVPPMRVRRS